MSYCSACGSAVHGAFCSSCGTKVVQTAAKTSTSDSTRRSSASSAIKRLVAVVVIGQIISTFFAFLNAGYSAEHLPAGVDPASAAMLSQAMQLATVAACIIGSIIELFIIRAVGRGSWKARRFLGYAVTLGIVYAVLVLLNYHNVTNGYIVASVFGIIFNSVVLSILNNQAIKEAVDDTMTLPNVGKRQPLLRAAAA